jgi:ApaG protein
MSAALTNGIMVTVRSEYIPERSSLSEKQFAFAYTVKIANQSEVTARLLSRHWIIMDAGGNV